MVLRHEKRWQKRDFWWTKDQQEDIPLKDELTDCLSAMLWAVAVVGVVRMGGRMSGVDDGLRPERREDRRVVARLILFLYFFNFFFRPPMPLIFVSLSV